MPNLRMERALTGESGLKVSVGRVVSFPAHSHSYYEMILYRPFHGYVTLNECRIAADEPFILLMTPADLHSVTLLGGEGTESIKAAFTAERIGGVLTGRLSGGVVLSPVPSGSAAEELFRKLTLPMDEKSRSILLRALVLLVVEDGEEQSALPLARRNPLIAQAEAIVGEKFQEDLTLSALAKRLNVSYQHLSACFPKYMGLSFSEYLADVRLRHAAALLRESGLSVTEICYACGYRNLSHFLRSFKRKYGVTPKEYRKNAE